MNSWIFQEATSMFNFNLNSYQKVYWTTNYYKEWYFGFSFNCWDIFFFKYCRHLMVSHLSLSFNDSQVVLTLCSLNFVAPMLACLKLHKVIINFVDRRLPRVTKSSIDKSFHKLVKNYSGINFFKFECSWKKSMACANIA